MQVKPLGNRVLVRRLEEEETGGIILPEEAKKDLDYVRAEVVEIGTDMEKVKVQKGDKVLLSALAGTKLTLDGEEYYIVKSSDILAMIE
ncbi:MAG: co-chaperone GroES [Candidatus Bipolaricaulota bacterium]|nr:co-chaperone GroES [Candidatus Bipolaricaulota bacterium]